MIKKTIKKGKEHSQYPTQGRVREGAFLFSGKSEQIIPVPLKKVARRDARHQKTPN